MENTILEWIKKYKKLIFTLLLGLVVFAVGSSLYSTQKEKQNQLAANELFKARKSLADDLIKTSSELFPAPLVQNKNDKNKESKNTEGPKIDPKMENAQFDIDTKLKDSVSRLKEIISKHPSTHAAFQASSILGDLYQDHTSLKEKVLEYYTLAAKNAQNALQKGRAHLTLGYYHENLGAYQEALNQYEQAYNQKVEGSKGDLLLAMGRCYQMLKNNTKAASIYEQLAKDFKNTEYAKIAEEKKKLLN